MPKGHLMFDVNPEKFAEGRELYQRGVSLQGLIGRIVAHRREFEDRERTGSERPDYQAGEAAEQSLTLGFADAVIEDIRKIAGGVRGGLRA